jgi:hypothetical protein
MTIKCPFCHATHVVNTVFCSECGNYLLHDDHRKTDPLETDEIGWVGDKTNNSRQVSTSHARVRPIAIQLKIGPGKRELEVGLDKVIHIGRVDPTTTVFPEVDLTEDGSLAKSVSRRHARILRQDDTVVLEDLGSINGTFINGKRLDPYMPEMLKDGDKVQLGKMPIDIKIQPR